MHYNTDPNRTELEVRRGEGGRFVAGTAPGPGRPKAVDFRKLVENAVEANGETVEDALSRVYASLQTMAESGSTKAAQLLLDRLCDKEPDRLHVTAERTPAQDGPPVPGDFRVYLEKLTEVGAKAELGEAEDPLEDL